MYAQSDFPVEVALNDDVYFGLSVEAAVSGLVLFVENCKATPSSTPGDSTEYYIIQDGCHQDDTLQEFPTASATSARYGISAFKFTDESLPYVYLHCDVIICLENTPGSRCDAGCGSSRRRRLTADDGVQERASLVQGPIALVPDPDENADGVSGSWAAAAVGASAAAAAVAVAIIAIATAKLACRAKHQNRITDAEGHDNMAFAQAATGPAEPASSAPYRNGESSR
ncbi:ZP domain-containing protein-like [Branchiostoma lanceolatum]|uniref:ZP domain-containing protein-like n=1 Tax=Branchiostoma lanceolatum TaxID=7740 RepID=UPI00345259B0